jgi:POT family proton-dependent oligopeptide transporter
MDIVIVAGIVVTILSAIPVVLQLRTQPRGLIVLFFAEMWERFSYYGMRALLIFYLTQHFLFDDRVATGQYGAYTTLIYMMPVLGGVLADRYIGTRKAIAFGAVLLTVGHLTLAIEGPPATQTLTYHGQTYRFEGQGRGEQGQVRIRVGAGAYKLGSGKAGELRIEGLPPAAPLPSVLPTGAYKITTQPTPAPYVSLMFLALSLIVVGVGFLKPNINALVGQLYPQNDPGHGDTRRDSGFTLFYYGINLGSFWAAILCGALGQSVGWWAGFGLAGLGMAAGLVGFTLGRPLLLGKGEPPSPARLRTPVAGPLKLEGAVYIGGLAVVGAVWLLLQHNALVGDLLAIVSVAILSYIGWHMVARCDAAARRKLALALTLMAGSIVYWTLEEQSGSSFGLFAARNVQLPHAGFLSMNAAQTQSFNPAYILIFAPAFAGLWAWLGRRGRNPGPMIKFAVGLMLAGLGFLVVVWGARFADAAYREPLALLAGAYLLITLGELCLSPVGLSEMTKLAPPVLAATLMSVWFLSTSWAEWLAGLIAGLVSVQTVGGVVLDPQRALTASTHVFALCGWAAVSVGLLFLALGPLFFKRRLKPTV